MSDISNTEGKDFGWEAAHEANNKIASKEGGTEILGTDVGTEILDSFENNAALRDRLQTVEEKNKTDELTKIFNRAEVNKRLEQLIQDNSDFALMYIDADHFKKVNDTYGHNNGDLVLSIIAKRMQKEIQGNDFVGRYGGEEFVLVMQGIKDEETAKRRADDIRTAIEKSPIHFSDAEEIYQTVSIGATIFKEGDTLEDVLGRADKLLYYAKSHGRNMVSTDNDLMESTKQ